MFEAAQSSKKGSQITLKLADVFRLSSNFSWTPVIVNTWGSEWLDKHRISHENNGRMESRLFRRACTGNVAQRWAEGGRHLAS